MIDDRTPNLDLPLPNINNLMKSEDVPRFREALSLLDMAVADRATPADITAAITALIGGAPGALNTLDELAAAIGDDASYAASITTALAGKLSAIPVASTLVLGGFKVGSGLVIDGSGVLSTTGAGSGSGLPSFAESTLTVSTNGQTLFTPSGGYVSGQIELYQNGVRLKGGGSDYTASNGTTITLVVGANTVDDLTLIKWYYIPIETAVNKTGDTLTGHLNTLSNASGTQVPQVQEVVKKTGDTMTGPLVVPAAASGSQAPRASEVVSKAGDTMTGGLVMSDQVVSRAILQDYAIKFFDSTTTNALDYVNGQHQRWAPNTGAQTLSIANWPPTGNRGEMLIEGVNLGAATITWPTINWVKSDGTFTTTFSANGVTLQASGIDYVLLWTRNAGTTIYGKVIR